MSADKNLWPAHNAAPVAPDSVESAPRLPVTCKPTHIRFPGIWFKMASSRHLFSQRVEVIAVTAPLAQIAPRAADVISVISIFLAANPRASGPGVAAGSAR